MKASIKHSNYVTCYETTDDKGFHHFIILSSDSDKTLNIKAKVIGHVGIDALYNCGYIAGLATSVLIKNANK